jgi:hypothetical protein
MINSFAASVVSDETDAEFPSLTLQPLHTKLDGMKN